MSTSSLFDSLAIAPPPAARPSPRPSGDPACGFCGCPDSGHCKGGTSHFHGKGEFNAVTVCITRHCNSPLCCCVEFVAPKETSAA
jgi:hypothetical protein